MLSETRNNERVRANSVIGSHDVVFITLDTLRYDVAEQAWRAGELPNLSPWLSASGWELRHSPGSFTYAAHHAFFSGFLPTPASPGPHPRLFAARFPGSETTGPNTCVMDSADIVSGLARLGYHTVCIGGVGFFNRRSPLGRVLPGLFQESYWSEELGVTDPRSTENQVALAIDVMRRMPATRRVFLFINVSAIHQPNCYYVPGETEDSCRTQRAALAYVDRSLAPLLAAARQRADSLWLVMSDHGTAYGEDGYHGHRLAHPVVWNVPYAEFILSQEREGK